MVFIMTDIIKVDVTAPKTDKLSLAAEIIRNGGLVAFPTETVYGLGGNATDADAAKKIYAAKGRPSDNPLIIHIASPEDAELYAHTNELYYKLARAFMPGPLTVILPKKDTVPDSVTGGLDSVAIRCPSHPIALKLISLAGVAIAAPSANLSGKPSPTSASHVLEDMDGRVDVIIDGGDSEVGLESTIVTLCEEVPTLLRPGGITYEMLCELLGEVHLSRAVLESLKPGDKVLSPGMMYKHYAPDKPVVLLKGNREKALAFVNEKNDGRIAVICYDEDEALINNARVLSAGKRSDNSEYASKLFALLRDTNSIEADTVFAFLPDDTSGISLAIYNRLLRAAGFNVIDFSEEN